MWFYLAVLSAFFNALGNVARRTHGSLAQPAELSWWTLLFSLPLGVALLLVSNQPHHTSNAYIAPLITAALINAVSGVLQFKAYKLSDASVVSPIANLLPILLLVTSFVMLGIVPNLAGLVGVLFVVAGVYYSSVSGKHDLFHPLQQMFKSPGSRAMLATISLWSVSTVLTKLALQSASPAYVLCLMQLIMFAVMSVYLLAKPQHKRFYRGEKILKRWGWHIAAISVFVTISVFLAMEAFSMVDPTYVISVKRLDILFTILLSGLFLHEKHIMKRFKGSVIALLGVVVIFFFQ